MTFYGAYTGQPAPASWSWTFGDGTTGADQTDSNRYSSAGTRPVTMTIKTGSCQQTVSHQVTVP